MDIPGYKLIFKCDRGAFGEVWLAEDAAGRRVALKIIEQPEFSRRELDGLRNYARIGEHPHLIRILHIEELPGCLYYTMEPADPLEPEEDEYRPATLSNILLRDGRMSAERVCALGAELLNGVAALHRAGLIHRDIKPENILYVNGTAKISDIGTLRPFAGTLTQSGTLGFIPPERLASFSGCISAADDLYALGKVLYCSWSGNAPELFPSIPAELLTEPGARQLNSVISAACAVDPKARFRTDGEFTAALSSGVPFGKRLNSFFRRFFDQPLAASLLIVAAVGISAVLILNDRNRRIAEPVPVKPVEPVSQKISADPPPAPVVTKTVDAKTRNRRKVPRPKLVSIPLETVESDGTPEGTRIHSFTVAAESEDQVIHKPTVRNRFNDPEIWRYRKLNGVERGHDFISWHLGSGWIWLPYERIGYPLFRCSFELELARHADVEFRFHDIYANAERTDGGMMIRFRFNGNNGSDRKPQLSAWSHEDGKTRISTLVPNVGKDNLDTAMNRIEIVRSKRDIQLFLNGRPACDPLQL